MKKRKFHRIDNRFLREHLNNNFTSIQLNGYIITISKLINIQHFLRFQLQNVCINDTRIYCLFVFVVVVVPAAFFSLIPIFNRRIVLRFIGHDC